jgi:photosystem II stability/assembly factor-like uncharacterized protein
MYSIKSKYILVMLFAGVLFISYAFAQDSSNSHNRKISFGKISGIVRDSINGEPIIGASIVILDSPYKTKTDIDGKYNIIQIAPGTYSVKASSIGYRQHTSTNIKVLPDQTTRIELILNSCPISFEKPLRKRLPAYLSDPKVAKESSLFWRYAQGLSEESVLSLVVDQSGYIYAGTDDGKIYQSIDNGETWITSANNMADAQVVILSINSRGDILSGTSLHPGCLVTAPSRGGIYRSRDHSLSWSEVFYTIWVHSIEIPTRNDIYVCSNTFDLVSEIYHSSDNGETWVNIVKGLPDHVHVMAVDSNKNIIVEAFRQGIFSRNNNDTIWTKIHQSFSDTTITKFIFHPSGKLFATIQWTCPTECGFETIGGILCSDDRGKTWEGIGTGLWGGRINVMIVDSKGHLLVGTESGGVFQSTNLGQSWINLGTELSDLPIASLAIDSLGYIIVGTDGYGIFKSIRSIY